MRKYLIAAVAAATVAGGAGIADAQSTGASLKVKVGPQKAGTKKSPKNSSVHLVVTNNDQKRTLRKLDIQLPKTLVVSGKGFKKCSEPQLGNNGPASCPKGSKVGGGTASALLGVNGPNPVPLTFVVTAFVGGANSINFYLHSTTVPVNVVAPGKVKKTSKGPKLIVTVPQAAQQPAPGTYAGLSQLDTTLKGKAGKHKLVASTGCKKHKQPFSTKLYFGVNPVSPAGTVSTSGAAKCR